MGEKPSPDHSIDRVDNNLGYWCGKCQECIEKDRPFNCRWATDTEQSINRRNVRWFELNGERLNIKDLPSRIGISEVTIRRRIKAGMTDINEIIASVRKKKT